MKKRFFVLSAILAVAVWLSSPAAAQMGLPAPNPDDAKLLAGNRWVEEVRSRGVLRVGFDIFRPWAMKAKAGNYVGFEIQVAEALAADMGVKAEFVPTNWDGIIPALLTDNFDIIIASMGITPERSLKVAFTEPYEYSGMAIAASLLTAPGLSSLEDFNKKEINVVVKSGTTAAQAAFELLPNAAIVELDDEGLTAQELRSGRAQVLIASAPYPAELALQNPGEIYVPIPGTLTNEPVGMALRPQDRDALPALNAWIAARFASRWLKTTWSYWFETLDWEPLLK
ncbi:MAG: transporter substrate-binding domain-containing protein [Candidatus Adiutrix sp.]|jgi:polar amino acid transport system substrate-binding protein|nr:transporter substrate-binding domain-containing protein [Candidatus Adiutrix sp.]